MTLTEEERQATLHDLGILDTPADPAFDAYTSLAAELFAAPIALVSLVDGERQWFKSRYGLDAESTERKYAFCNHAIRESSVFVVEDATLDPRFCKNPLVTGEPDIRFYAGAPLITENGAHIGTICIIDKEARSFSRQECGRLELLARGVVSEMQLRAALRKEESLKQAVEEALEEKVELIRATSHAVRTPLNVLNSQERYLREFLKRPGEQRALQEIRLAAARIRNSTTTLLEAAEGKLAPRNNDQTSFDPLFAVHCAVEAVEELTIERGITVEFDPSTAPFEVNGDPQRVARLARVLLKRAARRASRGSTLRIRLDRVERKLSGSDISILIDKQNETQTKITPIANYLSETTILVVDDIASNRALLAAILKKKGFRVLTADDGDSALELARETRPDIIFMDLQMPRMDGFEAARQIRACYAGNEPQIIAVTCATTKKDRDECSRSGMLEIITKPISPQSIDLAIRRAVQLSETNAA